MMQKKIRQLQTMLAPYGKVVIAFSGGVDSTFLLAIASDVLGADNILAVTAENELITPEEVAAAKRFAEACGVEHRIIQLPIAGVRKIVANPPDRCYHCKKRMLQECWRIAKKRHIAVVCDGANADDLTVYRPGNKAAEELNISRPLAACRFSKKEIRRALKEMHLPVWDKPSHSCLASRFPYHEKLISERIAMIAAGERMLASLGFKTIRLRCYGEGVRIEVGNDEIDTCLCADLRRKVVAGLKKIGFVYVTLDLEGYRFGSMDEVL